MMFYVVKIYQNFYDLSKLIRTTILKHILTLNIDILYEFIAVYEFFQDKK
jgi:hypothetical protein